MKPQRKANFIFLISLICFHNCHCAVYSPSGGPIYVNPNAAPVATVQPTVVAKNTLVDNHVTQTVYGFLDFTTTIGNTVMVFSPQSAAPTGPTTSSPPSPPVTNSVIETKPPAVVAVVTSNPDISPSRASDESAKENTMEKKSEVHIVVSQPKEKPAVPVKVSSNVQILSSHVEVLSENPKPSVVTKVQEVLKPVIPKKQIFTKVEVKEVKPSVPILSSFVEVKEATSSDVPKIENKPVVFSSIVEIQSTEDIEPVLQVENNIGDPEYDFLSRQPSEFAEETYRVHNIKSTNNKFAHKSRNPERKNAPNTKREDIHPTGLVTKLGGTVVKDGVTTVHETSVIGTYISGKYAQVLQSTSQIFHSNSKPKISPSSTLRILKTAAPHIPKNKHVIEPTPAKQAAVESDLLPIEDLNGNSPGPNLVRSSRRPAIAPVSYKNRFRNRGPKDENDLQDIVDVTPSTLTTPKKPRTSKSKNNRFNRFSTSSVELATVSVFSETSAPSYSSRRNKGPRNTYKPSPSPTTAATDGYTRRFKPKLLPTSPEPDQHQTSSLYKFKLNRAPGRWQYKTSPKPRVTIRKQISDDLQPLSSTPNYDQPEGNDIQQIARSDDIDLDPSGSVNGDVLNDEVASDNGIENRKPPVETLKVEISTPVDFKDTYYEIATIKSPYTFQVGSVKNTRYITVTSTFEKTLDPEPTTTTTLTEPLTENILATTSHLDKEHNLLDSSIATLPPILLSSDIETPPLETLTETFSTTHTMLKTHILPVIREGGNTTSYTLTQTYHITRLVTATKTLPPMDAYQFNPTKALKEFNSRLDEAGSELNLELDFGDDNEHEEEDNARRELPADLDLSVIGSEFDLSEVDKSNIPEAHLRPKKKQNSKAQPDAMQQQMQSLSPEQLQQLAILRLINPAAAAQIPQVITTSKPVVKLETVYESHVIPIFNGVSTSFSTISRPVATVSKTEYEIGTSSLPSLPIQQAPINPLFPQQPPQFQITTAPIVTQTMVTQTKSKVLKLTFGAKTAYTTLFSTTIVPTILTTFVTHSVQVQPTAAAFPGYFPAPYAPFPYVG